MTDGGEVGIAVSGMVRWRASRRASRSLDCASGLFARCLMDQPSVVAVVS